MPDHQTKYVDTPDGRLAVHVVGDGPPLLCIPGGPARASAYLEDLGGLDASYQLLLTDTRGSGMSELPENRESLELPSLADDVEAVRGGLGLGRVDVLAHSAGSLIALIYAIRHLDVVGRLVLVTPTARGLDPAVVDDIARIRASRSDESWWPEVAETLEALAYLPPHRRARMDRGLRPLHFAEWNERTQSHAAATDDQVSMRAAAAFVPRDLSQLPTLEALARLTAETLIVVGALDGVTGVRAGYVIGEAMPNARVEVIEECGHYPWVDQPDRFRRVVTEFLETQQ